MEIERSGEMVDYTIKMPDKRLVTIGITQWRQTFEMVLKLGNETERLQRDLECLVSDLKKLNAKT